MWLLDLSYLILRNEQRFPELALRLQAPVRRSSVWSREHWARVFWNTCLVIYCLPEVHLWGLTGHAYVRLRAAVAAYCGGQQPADEQERAIGEVVAALESQVRMWGPDRPRKWSREVQEEAIKGDATAAAGRRTRAAGTGGVAAPGRGSASRWRLLRGGRGSRRRCNAGGRRARRTGPEVRQAASGSSCCT